MLLSAGAELTLASAAAVGEDWFPDADDASLPLLGCLFLVCMLLWLGNRCGLTKTAFGGFAVASAATTVGIALLSTDCWAWLLVSAAVMATAAAAAFGPAALRQNLFHKRMPRRELARLAAFGEAAARLFHDLASPLTAVSLAVTELSGSDRSSAAHAQVERAVHAAHRLEDQLAHARKYARPGQRSAFYVRDELAALLTALSPHARRTSANIALDAPTRTRICGDPFQFYRAMSNIILNAIESCEGKEASGVTVSTRREGRALSIRVEDTGCGMDALTLARSRRASFTTKRYGTGLGLPIALDILESEFDARIQYQSVSGKGTAATILIPAALS